MSCTTEWIIKSDKNDKKSVVDRLLEIRGIKDEDAKREFLHPLEITLTHPNAFCDMKKAVERIVRAIDNKEKILIYGDFDADGVTSTSLLMRTIGYLGGEVDYYIPDRESEGHGLNTKALVPYMKPNQAKLIITVDNGISSIEAVKFINGFKKDVIITDHHEAPEELPPAYAIINPKAMNSLDEKLTPHQIESLTSLAGVGVAFKLAQGILAHYNKLEFCYELFPYVAVGTVADIVPLIGENRYFVAKGMELISQGKHYGLKRLLDVAGVEINEEKGLTSDQVAFTIAPRINASGRLDNVNPAIKLMISENKQEIEMAIINLENFNKVRQELCSKIFEEADAIWQSTGMRDNAIVLYNEDWHIGIIGIVASKFVEKYYKPTFMMNYNPETKEFRCSARGVKELNLYEIMTNISGYFTNYGGHQLAGGFGFSEDKASFEEVKKAINQTVDEMLGDQKLAPSLDIDLELTLDDIDISLVEEVSQLEPFGASNPSPSFVLKDLTLKQKKLMGSTKEHLKLIIDTPKGSIDCVWWGKGDIPLAAGDKFDVAFAPQLNKYKGVTSIQLLIKDLHSEVLKDNEKSKIKIYDHRKKTDIFSQVNDYIKNSKQRISVFVEDRVIADELKPYEYITKNIVNRNTAVKNDVLMFFDYPCSEDLYDKIRQTVCATAVHYMNYKTYRTDINFVLKNFAGMIKYCCNNQDGKFDIERASAAIGVTDEISELLLEIYADSGMIKIQSNEGNVYYIEMCETADLDKITGTVKYEELAELLNTINDYKNSFMSIEL